jgi:hypothetical protein
VTNIKTLIDIFCKKRSLGEWQWFVTYLLMSAFGPDTDQIRGDHFAKY